MQKLTREEKLLAIEKMNLIAQLPDFAQKYCTKAVKKALAAVIKKGTIAKENNKILPTDVEKLINEFWYVLYTNNIQTNENDEDNRIQDIYDFYIEALSCESLVKYLKYSDNYKYFMIYNNDFADILYETILEFDIKDHDTAIREIYFTFIEVDDIDKDKLTQMNIEDLRNTIKDLYDGTRADEDVIYDADGEVLRYLLDSNVKHKHDNLLAKI